MSAREFFSAAASRLSSAVGRGRRVEQKLDGLVTTVSTWREEMAKTDRDVLEAIKEARQAVEQHVKSENDRVSAAVDAAVKKLKDAWEADDEAAHEESIAELDMLKGSLSVPQFTPSGN